MCSIIGAIAGFSGILGTFASAGAQSQQVAAANRAAEYNANVARTNASYAEQQAKDARERGVEEAKLKSYEIAKTMGEQKTNFATSGVELSGSAEQVLSDTAKWGKYDTNKIKENAEKEAWGYEVQQTNYLNQANMQQASKQSFSPFGSILSGVTSIGTNLAQTYNWGSKS